MESGSELPRGWVKTKLGEFVVSEKGKKPKNVSKEVTDICSLPYVNIQAFEKNIIDEYTDGIGCVLCDNNDFLMVWDGSRSGYVGKAVKGVLGSTLVRINFPGILNDYAYYFLQSKYIEINTHAKGTGTPHVDPSLLWNYDFSIPPLSEQHRIVAKLEELFSELDKGVESLKLAQQQFKVYRQAVLKWAFEGKLTEEWRKEQKDLSIRSELLEEILTERAKISKESRKKLKPNINNNLGAIEETSELPILPEHWARVRLGNTSAEIFDGPFGSNLKSSDYVEQGIRVIRLENIGELEFFEDKKSYVTEEKYEKLKKHTVSAGDIIFSSFISEKVRVVLLPEYIQKAINKADCFCVRIKGKKINNKYLGFFLSSRQVFKILENKIHGVGRPRVNTTQLKELVIPICSLGEQLQIVQEIESRLSVCDKIEEIIEQGLVQAETLRQSILKKAFEGKLVPQDPNDEPAEKLLERIKTERESQQPKKTGKRRTKN